MAFLGDAAGDQVIQTTSLPANATDVTFMAWIYLESDLNTVGLIGYMTSAGGAYEGMFVGSDGQSTQILTSAGNSATGTAIPTAGWNHVCYTRTGDTHKFYLNSSLDLTLVQALTFTPNQIIWLSNGSAYINARLCDIKVWDIALSQNEIFQEYLVKRPNTNMFPNNGNLRAWLPTFNGTSERLTDYSGRGASFSQSAGVTEADNAPRSWGAPSIVFPTVTRLVSAAGTLTDAGSIVRQPRKVTAGTLTTAASIVRKPLKALTATLTTAATLVKSSTKSLAGTLTSSSTLTHSAVILRSISGTLTGAGNILRQPQKALSGSLTSSSTLTQLLAYARTLTGTLTPTGTLIKLSSITLPDNILDASGTLIRNILKTLTSVLTSDSSFTFVRGYVRTLSGSLITSASVIKRVNKSLVGTLTSSSTLTNIKLVLVLVDGTLTTASTLTKRLSRRLTSTLSTSNILNKYLERTLVATFTTLGSISKSVLKTLAGTLDTSSTLSNIRVIIVSIQATFTTSGTVAKSILKRITGALTSSGTSFIPTLYTRSIGGLLNLAGNLIRSLVPLGGPSPATATLSDVPVSTLIISDEVIASLAESDEGVGTMLIPSGTP